MPHHHSSRVTRDATHKIPSSPIVLESIYKRLDPLVKNWAIALLEHEKIHGSAESFNLLVWGHYNKTQIDAGLAREPTKDDVIYQLWQDVQSILKLEIPINDLFLELFCNISVKHHLIKEWEFNQRVSKILMDNGVTR